MANVTTHVVLILEDRVRLRNLTRRLQSELENDGFVLEPDGYGYPSVLFDKNNNSALNNLFIWLANHKAAFESDYKDIGGGPSGLMELIKNNGKYDNEYISCSYNGEKWNYCEK